MSERKPHFDASELMRLAKMALGDREMMVSNVIDRVERVLDEYPHDGALRVVQAALNKRFRDGGSLSTIEQNELNSLFHTASSQGNPQVIREHLSDIVSLPEANVSKRDYSDFIGAQRDSGTSMEIADSEEVSKLAAMFGDFKTSNAKFVDSGRRGLEWELEEMGISATVATAARDDNFVIYSAEITGPRGPVSVFVPAEIKLGSVLLPSVFVAGNDFADFTKENIGNFVRGAGSKLQTSATVILDKLNRLSKKATAQFDSDWSEVSAASSASYMFDQESFEKSAQNTFITDRADPVSMPEDLKFLTGGMIEETLVESGLSYSRDIVLAAKQVVANEIRAAGLAHDKIAVASEFPGGITLTTHLIGRGGRKQIDVPVEIVQNRPLMPSAFTSGVTAKPFTTAALEVFAAAEEGSFNPLLSDKSELPFRDIYNRTIRSAAFGNFIDVEDNLAVIQERFGEDYHRATFDDVMSIMKVAYISDERQETSELDRYINEFAKTASDRESNIKMMQNIRLLNLD